MDAKQLYLEREKMYTDLYNNVIPERFPIHDSVSWNFMMDYAGKDPLKVQFKYSAEEILEIVEKNMEILRGDNQPPCGFGNPIASALKQARQSQMNSRGLSQHPEKSYMDPEEYDAFIESPFDYFLENITPRINTAYAIGAPARSIFYGMAMQANAEFAAKTGSVSKYIKDKYGYWSAPAGSSAPQFVPFDFLSDHIRGFSKITVDIRRCGQKVADACDALLPFAAWAGHNPVQTSVGSNMIATHMAAYLSTKDFEKYYWPSFKAVCHHGAERGQAMAVIIEENWDRYMDYLEELPMGTRFSVELGDPKLYKERLGKKMVLTGFYKVDNFRLHTKEQCIDKAKELIDILAPGGNYYFALNKSALVGGDINPENYVATLEYVKEHNKYDNAGQVVNPGMTRLDTVVHYDIPELKSKYIIPFEEFIGDYPLPSEEAREVVKDAYYKYRSMLGLAFLPGV